MVLSDDKDNGVYDHDDDDDDDDIHVTVELIN